MILLHRNVGIRIGGHVQKCSSHCQSCEGGCAIGRMCCGLRDYSMASEDPYLNNAGFPRSSSGGEGVPPDTPSGSAKTNRMAQFRQSLISHLSDEMFHLKYVCYLSKLFQNHDKYNPLFMLHLKERFFKRRVSKNPKLLTRSHHVSVTLATQETRVGGGTR